MPRISLVLVVMLGMIGAVPRAAWADSVCWSPAIVQYFATTWSTISGRRHSGWLADDHASYNCVTTELVDDPRVGLENDPFREEAPVEEERLTAVEAAATIESAPTPEKVEGHHKHRDKAKRAHRNKGKRGHKAKRAHRDKGKWAHRDNGQRAHKNKRNRDGLER